ncbi:hypothetical protein GCM10020369_78060 [Cryptosporangium minutisporangium]|uniref:AP2-like integrase N-terminal domain-containing protein n=1 Tax=Cryptosporangium minutisporangium TaxID=113569 RepID=A0ABP6TCE8_9ACTN
MGYSRKRLTGKGKARYTAYYWDIKGNERSAGTFGSEKEADKAWQKAETEIAAGKVGDRRRGRQTLRHYVDRRSSARSNARMPPHAGFGAGNLPMCPKLMASSAFPPTFGDTRRTRHSWARRHRRLSASLKS